MSTTRPPVRSRTRSVPKVEPALRAPESAAADPPRKTKSERAKKQPTGDYATGYCRPPTSGQFPNRHSNKKGRPKGSRNLATHVRDELDRKIVIVEGGKDRSISRREMVANRLVNAAMKSDGRAIDTVIKIDGGYGEPAKPVVNSAPTEPHTELLPDEQAVLDEFMAMAREALAIEEAGKMTAKPRKRSAGQ